jgi:hypothetical protein
MIERIIGATLLRVKVYEEVEADKSATLQAMGVVILSALATGISLPSFLGFPISISGLIVGVASSLIGWALLAWITYMVGTRLFPTPETKADWGELARTLGFAQSPGILRVLGIVPVIGPIIFSIASIWGIVTTIIAIRQALDYTSTWRAISVTLVSYMPYALIMAIISFILPTF